MSRRILLVTIAIAIVGGSAVPTATAAKPEERHCVSYLAPIGPGSEEGAVAATLVDRGCYASLEAALGAGTGSEVQLEDDATPATLTEGSFATAAAADVLLGIEYNEFNYNGSSHSYYASRGCQNTTWEVSYVGNTWNDLFESGKGFGACDRNRKFEHSNFGGQVLLCSPNCSDYGALRDKVSSLRWKN